MDAYRIVDATGKGAGVELRPHDVRRTFITEVLAGHAQGHTAHGYAQAVDARKARKELRLRYR